MKVVFIGAPGSGKGTQSKKFISTFNFLQLSTGDLLRSEISLDTSLGKIAKSYMDNGKLVPDDFIIGLVEQYFEKVNDLPVILDGYPRTLNQAKMLDDVLFKINTQINFVIYFKIDFQVLVSRLVGRRTCSNCNEIYHIVSKKSVINGICDKCKSILIHRADDKIEVISERLEQFEKNTKPTIEYYRIKNKLIEINGANNDFTVFNDIKFALKL